MNGFAWFVTIATSIITMTIVAWKNIVKPGMPMPGPAFMGVCFIATPAAAVVVGATILAVISIGMELGAVCGFVALVVVAHIFGILLRKVT